MNSSSRKISLYVAGTLCTLGIVVLAGSLAPTVENTSTASNYTLSNIYTKLTNNTVSATEGNHSVTNSSAVATTSYTLADIYEAIPTLDATKILTGTTYMGVEGSAIEGTPALEWYQPFVWPEVRLCYSNFYSNPFDCVEGDGLIDGLGAKEYCANLGENGHDDWRLPDVHELLSVYSSSQLAGGEPGQNPSLYMNYNYWGSSPRGAGNYGDYAVYFDGTDVNSGYVSGNTHAYFYCVRQP